MKGFKKRGILLIVMALLLVAAGLLATGCAKEQKTAALSEYWTADSEAAQSLRTYVGKVTDPKNTEDFIPEKDRIAVFDMDGTLTCETYYTYYDTMMFIEFCLNDHPDRVSEELKEVAAAIRPGYVADETLARNFAKAYTGLTVEELYQYAVDFGQKETGSFQNMRYIDNFYLPMVEAVKYLYDNGFTIYVISGTERTTTRAIVASSPIRDYVTPNHVIGTDFEVKQRGYESESSNMDFKYADGDELVLTGGFIQKNLNANKSIYIEREIGQRPVLAFGNSGSDTSMMNYTLDSRNPYPAQAYMVVADDNEREWGTQDWEVKSEEYAAKGYIPISMRNDFAQIYAEGITKADQQFTEPALPVLSKPETEDAETLSAQDEETVPAVPDYSLTENWAYYAEGDDKAVDVFLVCPTVDTKSEYNMSLENEKTKANFLGALNMERGIYEDNARLFAPYYRQASMKVYALEPTEQEEYLALAYRDVSAAFSRYLEEENQGRPILLAGFSQGADMCYRLLEEYFGDEELSSRLVAVYAIGWPCTEELVEQYPQIRPAAGEDDLGVVVSFDCEAPEVEETFITPLDTKAHAINPLNWRTDSVPADPSENPGACFTDYSGGIKSEAVGLCGCYIDETRGALKVTGISSTDYPPIVPGLPDGAYHVYDYQFFFRALEQNVKTRVEAFMAQSCLDALLARGVLCVGTAGDYQPMSYRDPDTGRYVGLDAELAEDLAAALGVELEYVETSWPTLMEDTLAGKFDLAICGITITEARQEQALMSIGYLGNGKTVLCRAEDAGKYTSLEAIDRPEVRVMENPGGLNEAFAREKLPNATLLIHEVNQEIPGLIASGEADVMITEIMEAGYYVGQDSRLAAPLIHEPFTQGQLGVLMPKGSEALLSYVNAFLEEEMTSGRLDELAEEYIYRYTETEELDLAA
ncbi:MAG: DUF3089 domain-containing protein [Eubacteriales bacterium]|nr:DUF3089 domain-containing protein [Eubacteriales bacterium]